MDPTGLLGGMQTPSHQGYLTKLGFNSGKWQQRYFVLKGANIEYFTQPNGSRKGIISLTKKTICRAVEASCRLERTGLNGGVKLSQNVPPYAFLIQTSWKGTIRTFYLFSSNDETTQQWLAALNQAIAQAPEAPVKPVSVPGGMFMPKQARSQLQDAMTMANQMQSMQQQMTGPQGMMQNMMQGMPQMPQPGFPMQPQQQQQQFQQPSSTSPAQPAQTIDPVAPTGGTACSLQNLPSPPASSDPLPAFPAPGPVTGGKMGLSDMMAMAGPLMAATQSHQQDPHLSQEDNALALADKVSGITGVKGHNTAFIATLQALEKLLPEGLAGFVISEPAAPGTLGADAGLVPYDFMFAAENQLFSRDTKEGDFAEVKQAAFAAKGQFLVHVYNFSTKTYRDVLISMPIGKPNAILGVVSSKLPLEYADSSQSSSEERWVKVWKKTGIGAFMSTGQYMPVYEPPSGTDISSIYVKVWKKRGSAMISTNDYHPLYNYSSLSEPLYVKAWKKRGSAMVSTGDYAELPTSR